MGTFRKSLKIGKKFKQIEENLKKLDEELKKVGPLDDVTGSVEFFSEDNTPQKFDWRKDLLLETEADVVEDDKQRINEEIENLREVIEKKRELRQLQKVDQHLSNVDGDFYRLRDELVENINQTMFPNIPLIEEKLDEILTVYNKLSKKISEGFLNEPSGSPQGGDPLAKTDFVTFEQLKQHYSLFLDRISTQLATLGGGGEVKLKYLDDIVGIATNPSVYDGKYLKYDHTLQRFVFSDIGPIGIATELQTLNNVLGLGNTSVLGMSVGVSTFSNSVVVGGATTALFVDGNVRIVGVLTVGSGTVIIDGDNNTIGIGTAVLNETQISTFTNLTGPSANFDGDINVTGVVTATSFVGSGLNLTGIITSLVGYATEGYVDAAVAGFTTSGDLVGFVTSGALSGYTTTGDLVGFVTSGALSGYTTSGDLVGFTTSGDLVGFVTSGALSGYTTSGDLVGFTTSGDLVGFTTSGDLVGFITSGALSGYTTTGDLVGFTTSGDLVGFVTSGALSGYTTSGDLVGFTTSGDLVGFITSGALSGYTTTGDLVGFITSGALTGYTTTGDLVGFITSGALTGYTTTGDLVGFVTSGALSGYATEGYVDASLVGFTTSGDLVGFTTSGDLVGFVTSGALTGYANTAGIATVAQGLTGTPNISIGTLNANGRSTFTSDVVGLSSAIFTGIVTAQSFKGDGSGLTGIAVSLSLNDLSNVNVGGVSTGQVLKWSGTQWTAAADLTSTGGIGIGLTDLSVTVNSAGVSTLTYSNTTGVFTYTPPDLDPYLTGSISENILMSNGYVFTYDSSATARFGTIVDNNYGDIFWGTSSSSTGFHIQNKDSDGGLYLTNIGSGGAFIKSTSTKLAASFIPNAAVNLYYDDALKFSTTGVGVTVYGELRGNSGVVIAGIVTAQEFKGTFTGTASTATYATNALTAVTATSATTATTATNAQGLTGTPNITVGIVTATSFVGNGSQLTGIVASYTTTAGVATYATSSGIATYSTSSGISTYSTRSGIATYATSSGIATYATTAGIATNANFATNAGNLTGTPSINVGTISCNDDLSIAGSTPTLTLQDIDNSLNYSYLFYDASAGPALLFRHRCFANTNNFRWQSEAGGTVGSIDYINIVGGARGNASEGFVGLWTNSPTERLHLDGSLKVTQNINASGIVTAASFVGNGSGLTGINAGIGSTGSVNTTGIITATKFVGDGSGLTGVVAAGSGIVIQEQGVNVGTASTVNFVGTAVTVSITNGVASVLVGTHYANVSGIATVAQGLTGTPNLNVGVVTATSFVGNGSGLTGINASKFINNAAGIHTLSSVGVKTDLPRSDFQVGSLGFQSGIGTFVASVGVSTVIDSFTISTNSFKTAEYTLHFQHANGIQAQKILVMQDGASAYSNEYAVMYTSTTQLVAVGSTITSGVCQLLVTPQTGVTGITTYRLSRQTLL